MTSDWGHSLAVWPTGRITADKNAKTLLANTAITNPTAVHRYLNPGVWENSEQHSLRVGVLGTCTGAAIIRIPFSESQVLANIVRGGSRGVEVWYVPDGLRSTYDACYITWRIDMMNLCYASVLMSLAQVTPTPLAADSHRI